MVEKCVRFQVYVPNKRLATALEREVKAAKVSRSQAACRLMERGLKRSVTAEPAEQLVMLTRMFQDHRRATTQDLMLLQEMMAAMLREFFVRLPGSPEEADSLLQAAGEARLEAMFDAVAERVVRGERRLNGKVAELATEERVPEAAE